MGTITDHGLVNDGMVNFLRRPLAEHLDTLGPKRVEGLKAT